VLLFFFGAPAVAGAQNPATVGVEKKPAPPLLYKSHRRGIYKNGEGVEVIDATPQSPPLDVDDPGVPERGEYEVNFTSDADLSRPQRDINLLIVDANYGLVPRVFGHELPTQVKLEFPVSGAKEPDQSYRIGIGEAGFGLKFNFYNNERRGASLAFYPQLEFAMPGSGAVEKGIAEDGQTLILPLLLQKEFKYLTFVANGAVNKPIHDSERDMTGTLAFGFGRAITGHLSVMADIHGDSAFDFNHDRLIAADIAVMRRIRGTIIYFKIGHSLVSDGVPGHTYLGIGMKLTGMPGH